MNLLEMLIDCILYNPQSLVSHDSYEMCFIQNTYFDILTQLYVNRIVVAIALWLISKTNLKS